ncbi:MAG: AAA family ATPase [Mycolicibacterium sp.]|nr:AAA family ATPase [Mycolicibacterium sp.]
MHKDRTPGSCVGAKVIHVDWDGDPNDTEAVLEKVRALDGFAVASGTPGHIHAYVPLAEPVHAARAKLLCKAFQAALPPGSDKGKHSVNDLLRPPGTINHKTGARVEFLIRPGADRWDPMALEQYLGMCADASGNGSGVTNPAQVAVPVDLANYPHVRAALQTSVLKQDGTVDRSKTIYAVLGACLDDGLTLAEARAAVRSRADLADKLDGVGGDDATRIWLKLVDKQQGPQRITGDHRCDEAPISKGDKEKTHIEGMPRLWRATDLKAAAQPRWLAKGRIPCAAVSLLVGDEGIGKSLLWAWIIAAVTTGKALPEFGIPAREPSRVIIVVTEDGWQDTVLPRLEVAGADLNMIQVICTEEDGSGSPLFPRDLDLIRDADPPPSAVVVDAWLDTVHASLSVRDPQQARQALHPWKEVATTTGAAILLLCHTNRVATPNARDRYGATGELRKKARMTLYAQADEDGCLLVGPEKANGAKTLPASRFKAASVQYWPPTEEHDGTVPLLTYLGESEQTAREHLAEGYAVDHEPGTDDGVGWLAAFLGGGPRWSVDVHTAREEANISEKKLRAAKKRLNVDSRRAANDGPWFMALPQHAGRQPDAQMAPVSDAWTCGTSGGHLENPPALSTSQDSQRVDGETRGHLDDAEARRPRLGERCTVCLEHPLWAPESIRRGICEPCWQNSKSSNV